MTNINEVLRQHIKIIKTFDHPITRKELEIYGLRKFIRTIRHVPESTDTDELFAIGDNTTDLGYIKVSNSLLWYFNKSFNVRFDSNYTEEQFFQQSTVQNFYNLEPDICDNVKELKSLLEHLWNDI